MRTEDGYIINKCLNGNSAAFGFLVDKYKAAVYAFAYAELRNFHDAEDVTQEAFVKAYQKLHTLRRWDNFLAWLYSITSNLCKMFIRARSRRPDSEFIADQEPGTLGEPSVDPRRENPVMELLNEALDSLPEVYRRVMTLYYLGGMNSVEIARFLGTSPTAIRHRLSRGRSQLKEGMLAMMSQTLEGQRLQANFTFRIVEVVKRIKIDPMPRATALPWGLSLAAGIIFTVMNLNPHLSMLNPMATPAGSPLPVKTKVLKTEEIPVDILDVSLMPIIAGEQAGGINKEPLPDPQNVLLLAPQAGEGSWTTGDDMPTARCTHSASVVDGKIYVMGGGENLMSAFSEMEEYDPKTGIWEARADMLTPRGFHSASTVNGKIYAIGGAKMGPIFVSTVEEYDPATDSWIEKADMPTARAALSASVVNGKIYAIGGMSAPMAVLPSVEEYDPETDTWTKKANMPTPREGAATSVVNGKIYAIGGWKIGGMLSVVEEYDPLEDEWTKKTNMPTARSYLSTAVINGKIYAIGGTADGPTGNSIVEEYDPETDTWTKKPDMPTPRVELSTSVVDGQIYAIGGSKRFLGLAARVVPVLSTVEIYDPELEPTQESKAVEPAGKLPTRWGVIKASKNS